MSRALIAKLNGETVFEKDLKRVANIGNLKIRKVWTNPSDMQFEKTPGIQIYAAFNRNSNYAKGGPSQRIRILAPRRLFVDRPEPYQRVDLVRQRHGYRNQINRHAIRPPLRFV